ncbi:hypothetical protein WCX18_08860 [Sulfurimonas sp. HSL1-2]|uniref:hypothetical protein n=1 Tax=Thiomicrolovo zhangzhouensis TaxID=3131933 RepID=UPI0031FA416D
MKAILFLMAVMQAVWAAGSIEVNGTSSLHDWSMASDTVRVYMVQENGRVETLQVALAIETLKSGNEALDNDAYEAFGVDRACPVLFTLRSQNADGSLEGVMRIGRHETPVVATPDRMEEGVVSGTFETKMSRFGITPPSLFAGMMVVDDTVRIRYRVADDGVPIPPLLLRCLFPPQEGMAP